MKEILADGNALMEISRALNAGKEKIKPFLHDREINIKQLLKTIARENDCSYHVAKGAINYLYSGNISVALKREIIRFGEELDLNNNSEIENFVYDMIATTERQIK